MMEDLGKDTLLAKVLWETMMMTNDPYKTCVELGKCDKEEVPSPCHLLFTQDKECMYDFRCKAFSRKCSTSCYLCTWLVKDWPLFQEACKPAGAVLPQSAILPTDKLPPPGKVFSFLEEGASVRHSKRWKRALAAKMRATANSAALLQSKERVSSRLRRVFPYNGAMPRLARVEQGNSQMSKLKTGLTASEQCMKDWQFMRQSAKGRYLASWQRYVNVMADPMDRLSGNMWDANVVCKCLGKCRLNRFEELGLMDTCHYEEDEEAMMRRLFMNGNDRLIAPRA